MKAIIIDNNKEDVVILKNYLARSFSFVNIIAEAASIKNGVEAINKFNPDIIFIDVILSDGIAFNLISHFKHLHFKIIFTSSDSHYAIKAMRHGAFDYLLKPIDIEDLVQVFERINTLSYKDDGLMLDSLLTEKKATLNLPLTKKIALATDNSIYIVDINDIMHCDADNGYSVFYLSNNTKIMVTRTLKEYEALLEPFSFIRTHKSHLVNFNYIIRYSTEDGGSVILSNNKSVPVSSRKRELIIKTINDSSLN